MLASTSARAEGQGADRVHRRARHARLPHRQAHREDGPARLRHHRAGAWRTSSVARRAAPGRDRPRLLRHAEDPRQGAHRHRRLVGRHRPRGVRGGAPLRQGARAVRQADRRVPGDPAHAGRHGDRARRRAPAGLARGAGCRTRRSAPPRESSIAKYYAARATMRACNDAIQIHGGYGYTREFDVERYLRDAKLAEIGEGTNEVQKMVIARELLRRRRAWRLQPAHLAGARRGSRRRRRADRAMRWRGDRRGAVARADARSRRRDRRARARIWRALYPRTAGARSSSASPAARASASRRWSTALIGALPRGAASGSAVVAVDPSSPFSGGALLGDRVRMQRHATDDGVFIRSLATRGQLGGLSRSTVGVGRGAGRRRLPADPHRDRRRAGRPRSTCRRRPTPWWS